MEGNLGPIAATLDVNMRLVRGMCLVLGTVTTSTQSMAYVEPPGAASGSLGALGTGGINGVFAGVVAEDLFETGFSMSAEVDPTTVIGTIPQSPSTLLNKNVAIVRRGRFPLIASGIIAHGGFVKNDDQ